MRYQKASTCSRNSRTEYCNTVTSWAPLIIILFNIQFKLQILHQIDPANTPIYSGGAPVTMMVSVPVGASNDKCLYSTVQQSCTVLPDIYYAVQPPLNVQLYNFYLSPTI